MNHMIYIDEFGTIARVAAEGITLRQLQDLVGGLITITDGVVNNIGVDIIANDEALYLPNMGINLVASYMTGRQLVGPVLLATADAQGNTRGFGLAKLSIILQGCDVEEDVYQPYEIVDLRTAMFAEVK